MVPSRPDSPGGGAVPPTDGLGWTELADAVWLTAVAMGGRGSPLTEPAKAATADQHPTAHAPGEDPIRPGAAPPTPSPRQGHAPARPAPRRDVTTTEARASDDVRSIVVPALPGSRNIARALRPFKRRVPSTTEFEPDEEATAERAADEGLWLPQSRPAQARWLALALIVDGSPSMAVWRPTITAFRLLLERHGAFRDVREVVLSLPTAEASEPPDRSGPRIRGPGTGPRDPAELLDPSGRQIFLVLTDGINQLWQDPRTARLLRLWGRSGPLAIVNPYPQGHWHRTRISPRRARLYAPRPVAPNDRLRVRYPDELRNPFDQPVERRSLPIPVLELSPRWTRWWTRLVTDPHGWVDGLVHPVDPGAPVEDPEPAATDVGSSQEVVLRFRSSASPLSFRLATYLAAAPLDLPLLRKVQRVMLPGSAPFHLAEVVTSDLVRHTGGAAPSLEFADGVREALLACATRDDSAQVVRTVAAHYSQHAPAAVAFTRAIEAPDQTPDPPVTRDTLPMARIELAVLNALSGPYARRAHRLRRSIAAAESASNGPQPRPTPRAAVGTAGGDENGEDMPTEREPNGPANNAHDAEPALGHTKQPFLADDDPILSVQALLEDQDHETGPAVWGNVPPRNPSFTGRRELLAQLERRLQTESVAAVLPQALHGMGGVGKSQIAIEYAYRHRSDYDVIWWVPSERQSQILASLIELGDRLGLDVGIEANTAVPRVRAALRAGTPYANWLLVFDNAETLETVRDYFPEAGTGKVLVTSRNPEWSRVADTLEVDVFTRAESVRLLQRRNPEMSGDDADRLAEAMGDLPLAVEHASAWEAATRMAVSDYLGLLEQKRTELEALVPAPGYEMPVAAAANVALDRLGVENPAALQLLQVCAFFAPEPIGRELFTGPRITPIAPELDEVLQNPSRLNQAIRDIQRYVLARIDHRTNTIQLHRLVQSVLLSRMTSEQRTAMEHGAHVLLAGANPGAPSETTQWLRYQALASHVTASNALNCEDDWARELVLNLIEFYFHWGDYDSCRELAQRVVAQWRTLLGADHPQTLRAGKWLGFVLRVLGDFAHAAVTNADCLERYRRTVGLDDEGTIDAMSLVAADLRVAGKFAEARDLDLDAFQRARRVFGEDEPDTLRAAHSLGVSLRLTGDFRTARQLDSDTYRRRVAILGAEHPETLWNLNNLTIDERECGEYLKAHRLQERLYQRYLDLFGVQHPRTIAVARNLAVARRRAGDHDGARKLAEDTMNRFRDRFGPAHPDAIAAALNFAVDVREADDLSRARAVAAQTAEQYHSTLGPHHPYTLYARTNLGIVLRLQGQPAQAYEHNLAAWETLEHRLGPNHVLTLTCATNLASDRAELGDHQGAYDLDAETLRRSRQVAGAEHPTTLACALNLAFDLSSLGRSDESVTLFDETLTSYSRVLGSEHPAITAAVARIRANCDVDPMPF
jgi:hypothetical protein